MEELFSKRRPEYPWQLELPPWAPHAKLTESERRADFARFLFEHEKTYREEGLDRHPMLFYDEAKGFFFFGAGTFALSRERANWPAPKEKGFFSEWGMRARSSSGAPGPRAASFPGSPGRGYGTRPAKAGGGWRRKRTYSTGPGPRAKWQQEKR